MKPSRSPESSSPHLAPPLREGQLVLADGRRLGWAEYGCRDGRALCYCHGSPGSRLEGALVADAARCLGLRLIAVDRPGYGLSTLHLARTARSFARDLECLATALELEAPLLLGVSGGGPFAATAAHQFGPRLGGLGLVCGVGPLRGPGSPRRLPLLWRLLRMVGPPGRLGRQALAAVARRARDNPAGSLRLASRRLATVDRRLLTNAPQAAALAASLREALRQGAAGLEADLRTFAAPWDFDPATLRCRVCLWHGTADRLVPQAFSAALARQIPGSRLTLVSQAGHFSLPLKQARAILAALGGRFTAPFRPPAEAALHQEAPMDQRIAAFLESPAFGVVGASTNRSKYGNKVLRCYLQNGRQAIPVNPHEETIEGVPCVTDVAALPEEVASISIITPPPVTDRVVEAAIARGIRNLWMQPGAESAVAVAACRRAGLNVIADGSCLLVVLGYRE